MNALAVAALLILTDRPLTVELTDQAAWQDACELSRYTCEGLDPPEIRETVFVGKAGALGYYFGGRTVWLVPHLEPQLRYVVIVHEMVHYLQCYEDDKCFPHAAPFENCIREEEAYEVSDKVAIRLGRLDLPRLILLRAKCLS